MKREARNRGVLFSRCSIQRLTYVLSDDSRNPSCNPEQIDRLDNVKPVEKQKGTRAVIVMILYVAVSVAFLLTLAGVCWCILRQIVFRQKSEMEAQRRLFSRRDSLRHEVPA